MFNFFFICTYGCCSCDLKSTSDATQDTQQNGQHSGQVWHGDQHGDPIGDQHNVQDAGDQDGRSEALLPLFPSAEKQDAHQHVLSC